MRSPSSPSTTAVLVGIAIACLPLLSGCGGVGLGIVGTSRADFVSSANTACRQSAGRVSRLHRPDRPDQVVGYAIDLFADKDRLLIGLNEMGLPDADAATLRAGWLRPATADLDRAVSLLAGVHRAVVAADRPAWTAQLDALRRAGTAGVDDSVLVGYGLTDCLVVFGDPRRS